MPEGHITLLLLSVALQELQGRDSKMQQPKLKSCQDHDGGVQIGEAVNAGEMLTALIHLANRCPALHKTVH